MLTNHWRKRLWISLHNESAITQLNHNIETRPFAAIMSARRKRVISTDETQFNHKPSKILLTGKRRESAEMAKPQILLGSAHIVYKISQYLSEIKYCSI